MEGELYLRAVLALAVVLGLIAGAGWAAKRFGLAGARVGPRRRRRLAIAEALPLDSRRRLILIRRDDTEHLLLIGGGTDLIIEKTAAAPAVDGMAQAKESSQ